MRLLRSIGAALLAAWLYGCASTVNSSAVDAQSDTLDAQPDAALNVPDAPGDLPGDVLDAASVRRGTVAVGGRHVCAIDARDAVWCWGNNDYGQLGDGTTERRLTPVRVVGLDDAVQLAIGATASCAIVRDRTVRCWGLSFTRSVEPRPPVPRDALMLVPTAIANLDRVRSLVVNAGSSGSVACAVRDDASVTCWGFTGRVPGYPVGQRVSAPTAPAALTDVAALSFESLHKCAVARSGTVACWDFRPWDETYPLSITPMMLDGIVDARGVTGGGRHLCVLSRRGTVVCIGDNNYGQLGDGSMTASPRSFVSVRGLTDAVAITSGAGIGMAALRADGTVVTWGSFYANRRALAAVPGLQSIVDVSAGLDTFCARRADGAVFCWGGNNHGQLGNDSQRESQTPVRIAGFGP